MVEAGREGGVHVHVHLCAPGLLQGWWETISWWFSASYMRNESVRWVVGLMGERGRAAVPRWLSSRRHEEVTCAHGANLYLA